METRTIQKSWGKVEFVAENGRVVIRTLGYEKKIERKDVYWSELTESFRLDLGNRCDSGLAKAVAIEMRLPRTIPGIRIEIEEEIANWLLEQFGGNNGNKKN